MWNSVPAIDEKRSEAPREERCSTNGSYSAKKYYQSDSRAEFYDDRRFVRGSRRRDTRELRLLRCALDRIAGVSSVLDLACGSGRIAECICGGGRRLVGLDVSPVMVKRARANVPGATFVVGEAERLPFDDDAFDVVTCVRLLHHVPSSAARIRILDEIHRVCRRSAVVTFFRSGALQDWRRRFRQRRGRAPQSRVCIPLATLRWEAATAGFEIHSARGVAPWISEQWVVTLVPRSTQEVI